MNMDSESGKAGATVGAMLRAIRLEQGLTLRQLRQETRISVPYLNQIERDEVAKPSRGKIRRIATALGMDPEVVLREQEKSELVKEFGLDADVAELVLRLREVNPHERTEMLERLDELFSGERAEMQIPDRGELPERRAMSPRQR